MKKIKQFKRQYKEMNAVQQKFIKYFVFIKIAVLIIGIGLLVLAWQMFQNP